MLDNRHVPGAPAVQTYKVRATLLASRNKAVPNTLVKYAHYPCLMVYDWPLHGHYSQPLRCEQTCSHAATTSSGQGDGDAVGHTVAQLVHLVVEVLLVLRGVAVAVTVAVAVAAAGPALQGAGGRGMGKSEGRKDGSMARGVGQGGRGGGKEEGGGMGKGEEEGPVRSTGAYGVMEVGNEACPAAMAACHVSTAPKRGRAGNMPRTRASKRKRHN